MAVGKNTRSGQETGMYVENLVGTEWIGVVEDNNDPLKMGRCKIRILEMHEEVPIENIPWSFPANNRIFAGGESKGFGNFSYPKIGTTVKIRFFQGDKYSAEYYTIGDINESMQTMISESYENSQVLFYDEDEDARIYYTKEKGIHIYHKGSHINIDKNKHITIEHVGSTSIITLIDGNVTVKSDTNVKIQTPYLQAGVEASNVEVGPDGFEPAVRGGALMQCLNALAGAIDAKVPGSGMAVQSMVSGMAGSILSTTVKIAK